MEKPELCSSACLSVNESVADNAKFEYEAQHFGFTPTSFLNGIFNTICDTYREALKAFCNTCSEKLTIADVLSPVSKCYDNSLQLLMYSHQYPNVMTDEELRSARHTVSQLIDKDVSNVFDTLEYFLLNQVFSVPENAVLSEDKCQLQRLPDDEHNEMETKIDDVKRRIIAIKYANSILEQHLKDSEKLQGNVEKFLKHLSSSENSLSQLEGTNLKDWISYYSEMLIKSLNPHTQKPVDE